MNSRGTSLRRWIAGGAGRLSGIFFVLWLLALALAALCVLAILAGELDSFLRAPLGFKDEPLTGLPALAETAVWPPLAAALVFWFVDSRCQRLSKRWRCTVFHPDSLHGRCWLAPGHSGLHFYQISGRKYYWPACVRCGKFAPSSELCEECRLLSGGENVLEHRESHEELARARLRVTGWDDSATLEGAIETAIRETGATSLTQMGLVIKTARGRLGGSGRYDEQELQNAVRARLRGKP